MDKKIIKNIKLDNRLVAALVYKRGDKEINKITEIIKDEYNKLEEFFSITIPVVNIELVYSRREINNRYGHKTPSWLVGFVNPRKKNNIYVVSPSVCEKISSHKKENIFKVVIHELSHIFINKINNNALDWLNEGLALKLASQFKKPHIKKENWNFLIKKGVLTTSINWQDFAKCQGYEVSFFLVSFLIKNYGKDKILELIKIDKKSKSIEEQFYRILRIKMKDFIEKIKTDINNQTE